ncbi:uncharacterized protein ARMOST_02676 [Armillaria ostoyae]|uniref:Uncharacterized protein n=1 Tax=Armillaria ostoyae TaxID=47428 RepID=A0A284QSC8_ARMOS|nr:uncharacterized protein ARMOST_02676 [Armillaria ostoyae]
MASVAYKPGERLSSHVLSTQDWKPEDDNLAGQAKQRHEGALQFVAGGIHLPSHLIHLSSARVKTRMADAGSDSTSLCADEPPGSVRSEFADLSIHHPISSK